MNSSRSALFLDRDGVLCDWNFSPTSKPYTPLCYYDEALDALAVLRSIYKRVFIVTNQGYTDLGKLYLQHRHLLNTCLAHGVTIDAIVCATNPDDPARRKPGIGMIRELLIAFPDVDLKHSTLVGDQNSDIEAAIRSGIRQKVLLTNGIIIPFDARPKPDLYFTNLKEFADWQLFNR